MIVNPVPGSTYSHDWGAPRSGGRTHEGLDLFAPAGTDVLAPAGGYVDTSRYGWGGLGGLRLWIDGDDGRSYYLAHLSRLVADPGDRVLPGQVVGKVGNTGNAAGTPPHLHLGIRNSAGAWIDPYPLVEGSPSQPSPVDANQEPSTGTGADVAESVADQVGLGWATTADGRRRAVTIAAGVGLLAVAAAAMASDRAGQAATAILGEA